MEVSEKAILFAVDNHSGSVRKGSDTPYIVHPMEALSIAAGITNDPEVLAAVVLHDVVEDTDVTVEEIKNEFGGHVASLVASATEDKMIHIPPSESWKARKDATIEALKGATFEERIIVLADKLSNIRAIYRDMISEGNGIWGRFNQKDRKMQEWYYRSILETLSELSDSVAYQEFDFLVNKAFTMCDNPS